MDEYQHELWDEAEHEKDCCQSYRRDERLMPLTQSTEESQTGQTTDKERGSVYHMSHIIVDLGLVGLGFSEDILNVFNVSSTPFVDQDDAKYNECDEQKLEDLSAKFIRPSFGFLYKSESSKPIIQTKALNKENS